MTHAIIVLAHYHSNIFLDDVYKRRCLKRCRSHTSFHPSLERTALKRVFIQPPLVQPLKAAALRPGLRLLQHSAFSVYPTIKEIIHSGDNGEGKYDDTSNEGNKDKDRENDRDEVSGGNDEDADKGREVDKDEDYVAKDSDCWLLC